MHTTGFIVVLLLCIAEAIFDTLKHRKSNDLEVNLSSPSISDPESSAEVKPKVSEKVEVDPQVPEPVKTEPKKKSKRKGDGYRTRSGVKPLHWNVVETPPPDYRKFRSCELKQNFKSLAEAESVIGKMIASGKVKKTTKILHAYKCDFCIHYHIGHKAGPTKSTESAT